MTSGADFGRQLAAELIGTTLLTTVVVGSGIAAQRLSPDDGGLQLLQNAAATALGLFAIIAMVGPVSGAHLNPAVSLAAAALGGVSWRTAAAYVPTQILGCVIGAVLANAMFAVPAISISTHHRASVSHLLGEVVATAGLIALVFVLVRSRRRSVVPAAVGAYIGAAYFFTSSTGFANPAITVGRTLSDTFAGIAPASAPAYIVAQLVGAAIGLGVVLVLSPLDETADPPAAMLARP